jgi:hypothetical protein
MAGLVLFAVPRSASAALPLVFEKNVGQASGPLAEPRTAPPASIARTPPRLPAGFEENRGQAPQDVKFLGSVGGHRVFFTSEGVQFTLVKLEERPADASGEANPLRRRVPEAVARVGLLFDGASPEAHVVGGDLLPGRVSYLVGPPSDWRRDIPLYARVRYEGVYPGIDAVFYDAGGWLKYDFLVSPGAEPGKIQLRVDGAEGLRLTEEGDLLIETAAGEIRQRRPFVYQEREGAREEVGGSFAVTGSRVTFTVGPYDRSRALVIDPQIGYSTYIGGNRDDQGFFAGLAVDGEGNAYVAGETNSATGLLSGRTTRDAFVAKIDPKGERLLFLVYLGGAGDDRAFDVFVDGAGSVYVTGSTSSPNFTGADPSGYVSIPPFFIFDAFLVKLTSTGALVYSRYFGLGSGFAIAADREGNAYLASAGFVDKFDPLGQHLARVSFVNEGSTTTRDLRLDAAGNIYATGHHAPTPAALTNAFVARVSADLGSAAFVLLPSSGGQDVGWGLATDSAGNVYVAGETNPDPNLPSQKSDAFVAKLAPDLSLVYLTRIGGSDLEEGRGVAADGSGNIYVTGLTISPDFPTKDPFTTFSRVAIFVMKLKADTSDVVWSTLIGGNAVTEAATIAVDGSENVYVQGRTSSTTGLIGPGGLQPSFGGGSHDIFLIQIKQEVRARIEVLPTTTRWRPQRDHSTDPAGNPVDPDPLKPVVINFTAPKGYTPMSLEITDPTGALLVSPSVEIAGPIDPKADPGQYTITWSGPWSLTDPTTGELKYEASGNYTFKIRGTKADGTVLDSEPTKPCADAAAGTPTCSVVSLVEVTAVTMMDKPRTRGRVPNRDLGGPGGGWAIFPEARNPSPNDQVGDEDKVEIVATVSPAVPDPRTQGAVTVHFRGLDVDDPSAGLDPVTGTSSPVDNEALAQDNCPGGGCAVPSAGNVNGQSADAPVPAPLTAGQTQVRVDFEASARQGDNYRVSASTSSAWLQGLSAKQNSAFGEVVHSSGERILDADGAKGPQVSEMLTVWRTVHLELDRVQPALAGITQEQLQVNGSWTEVKKKKLTDVTANFRDADHPKKDDWEGGDLNPFAPAGQDFLVDGNDATSVKTKSGDLRTLAQSPDPRYYLRDDLLTSLTDRTHDLSLLKPLLESVYIKVMEHPGDAINTSPDLDWVRTMTEAQQQRLPRETVNSEAYWAVPLILAVEGVQRGGSVARSTHDPTPPKNNSTSGLLGLTTQGDQPNSATFNETIRDFAATNTSILKPTVPVSEIYVSNQAHEVLHALTLWHNGGVMCATRKNYVKDPMRYQLTDLQRAQLRFNLTQPKGIFQQDWTCGVDDHVDPDCCPETPPK